MTIERALHAVENIKKVAHAHNANYEGSDTILDVDSEAAEITDELHKAKLVEEKDIEIAALKKQIKDNNILNLTNEENITRTMRHMYNLGVKSLCPETFEKLEAVLKELNEILFPELEVEDEAE